MCIYVYICIYAYFSSLHQLTKVVSLVSMTNQRTRAHTHTHTTHTHTHTTHTHTHTTDELLSGDVLMSRSPLAQVHQPPIFFRFRF